MTSEQQLSSLKEFFPILKDQERKLSEFRTDKTAFVRDSKLTLTHVVGSVIALAASRNNEGYDTVLQSYFSGLPKNRWGHPPKPPGRSALTASREKISWKAFEYLLSNLIENHCASAGHKKILGHRAIAIDGTRLTLPDCRDLDRSEFFCSPAQASSGELPFAVAVCGLEISSGAFMGAIVRGCNTDERALFQEYFSNFKESDLFVMDRGFTGFEMMEAIQDKKMFYLIRCQTGSEKWTPKDTLDFIEEFIATGATDQIREIVNESEEILRVRMVMYWPKKGKPPMLLVTNLLDKNRYPARKLAELYGRRWEIETGFNRLKHMTNIEKFRARKGNGILQEIYAHLWVQAVLAIVASRVQVKKKHQGTTTQTEKTF